MNLSAEDGKLLAFKKMNKMTYQPDNNVFMLPPIESVFDILYNLAEKVKANVYGAEFFDHEFSSICDLAEICQKDMKNPRFDVPYKIVGYSFGAVTGFELARMLERKGFEVELVLIDGSPHYLKKHCAIMRGDGGPAGQVKSLMTYLCQFVTIDYEKIRVELCKANSWEERVEIASKKLSQQTKVPAEKIAKSFNLMFNCAKMILDYVPASSYQGDIILIKASDNFVDAGEDYGLSSICTGKITIKAINSTHRSIVDSAEVGNLVNKYLNLY